MRPEPFDAGVAPNLPAVDREGAAQRLSNALRHATVSMTETAGDPATFRALHEQLRRDFPRVHDALTREAINEHSAIYRWAGTDPSLAPILLLAHTDVVPVEQGTQDQWEQPPFSGAIVDGEVWGRGAMDDKTAVVGILEAAETLLAAGFAPRRGIVLAFGHDEEIGGREGAIAMAAALEKAGERFELILDEGGAVVSGSLPGVDSPVAFVGIAEKGYAAVEIVAQSEGGHSSMPAAGGPVAAVGRAVMEVDKHQMPARIDGPTRTMVEAVGPHMPFGMRIGLANLWLLEPIVAKILTTNPASAASVRTTTAPTMFDAGTAENVLPSRARAVVNFRILPGDTTESVLTHVRAVIGDPSIEVRCLESCWDPSPIAPVDTEAFAIVRRAIMHSFADAVVAPYLVVGATDARHYAHLAEGTYRFLPIRMLDEHRARLHGTGERISVDDFVVAVRFYMAVMKLGAGE